MINALNKPSDEKNYADAAAQFAYRAYGFSGDQYNYIVSSIDKQFMEIIKMEMMYQEFIAQRGDYFEEKYPDDESKWESYAAWTNDLNKLNEDVAKAMDTMLDREILVSVAGYGFEIYHDKGKDTLMSILLLAMMLPFVAIMIPLFKMFTSWGLVNTWIALALPTISTPFMIMLFRQAARSFPHDIIEAARLEGLSEVQIFFKMFIPVMKSTYGAAMTVTFMSAWNNYLWPTIILQDSKAITMPMLVANLKSGYSVDYGMLMLGVLICTLPTAIIFLCLQKSFANGITGAVK